jgi:hypothetical protein
VKFKNVFEKADLLFVLYQDFLLPRSAVCKCCQPIEFLVTVFAFFQRIRKQRLLHVLILLLSYLTLFRRKIGSGSMFVAVSINTDPVRTVFNIVFRNGALWLRYESAKIVSVHSVPKSRTFRFGFVF